MKSLPSACSGEFQLCPGPVQRLYQDGVAVVILNISARQVIIRVVVINSVGDAASGGVVVICVSRGAVVFFNGYIVDCAGRIVPRNGIVPRMYVLWIKM